MGRHGENIRFRSDGRWEARILNSHQENGKRRYKYIYGKSYQEVKQRKEDYLRGSAPAQQTCPASLPSAKTQPVPNVDVVFECVAVNWLSAKRSVVKESTYTHYVNQIEKHLLPTLGKIPIQEIDSAKVEAFLTGKKQSGRLSGGAPLSASSVADIKLILMQILQHAKVHGLLSAVPDCPAIPCTQPPISVLSKEEQKMLVSYILDNETPFTLGVLIALYAGLRIGEVCALQWGDFNFSSGTVTVSKTIMRIYDLNGERAAKTKVVIDRPKTHSSLRTVPLTEDLAIYFQAHHGNDDAFLVTGTGKFMEPRVCLDRYKRLLHRAGLPDYNFHLLRHTFATRCVEQGVDMKSLSEMMGHSSVSVTMQRYVHPSMALKREQINKINEPALRGRNLWSKQKQNTEIP